MWKICIMPLSHFEDCASFGLIGAVVMENTKDEYITKEQRYIFYLITEESNTRFLRNSM